MSTASLVAMGLPVVSVAGRIGLGWLGDRVGKKWIAVGGFAAIGFGLICFGSRLEVVLPMESTILVQAGQKVRAGETPIGVL